MRTAPHHFATDEARLLVLSSPDRRRWTLERVFDLDRRDLREPRFLVHDGRLLFYFFEAGDDPLAFRPISIRVAVRGADGSWGDSRPIGEPGRVVWRVKSRFGRAWMTVYHGAGLYEDLLASGGVRLLVSDDGIAWESTSGDRAAFDDAGGSECAFEFDAEGNLVALIRVEAWGAQVCTAPADRLERWDCTPTLRRHDSPLLLRRGEDFYAIARRNVAAPMARDLPLLGASLDLGWSMLRYSASRKRTALYQLLPSERRTVPLLDLPSRGDTAFAGAVWLAPDRLWVTNYTSPLDGPDVPWIVGQLRPTHVYGLELGFPARTGLRRQPTRSTSTSTTSPSRR